MANEAATKHRQPGPGLWLSLIVTGLGLFAASWGVWQVYNTVLESITRPAFDIPGAETRDLAAGDYEIYVRTGSAFDFDLNDVAALPALDEITVTALESGDTVPLEELFLAEPAIRGTNRYDSVASFTVDDEGSYRVEIDSGSTANRAVLARTFETGLEHSIPWIITTGVGTLVMLLGSILLIIGMVRRSRAKKPQPPVVGNQQQPSPVPPASSPQSSPFVAPTAAPPPPPPTRGETQTPWGN